MREYRMKKRAEVQARTRDKIINATMQLHDQVGISATSYLDVAQRSGVGVATVYRHFPSIGSLVVACGGHVWKEMQPPIPEHAPAKFLGLKSLDDRLKRLVRELDEFYRRGAFRLTVAARDRSNIPEIDTFLGHVERGVEALVREALRGAGLPDLVVRVVIVMSDLGVWTSLNRLDLSLADLQALYVKILQGAISAAR
jgi:AcrR family transcriptional regulator